MCARSKKPKIDEFSDEVLNFAKQERDQILFQIEKEKEHRFKKAEDEVLDEVYKYMQKEMSKIRGKNVREISIRKLDIRKAILKRRLEITNDIFNKAYDKLLSFTKSDMYEEKLSELFIKVRDLLPSNDTVFYIAKKDEKYLDHLTTLCPKHSQISLDDGIKLGGVKGISNDAGRLIDCTLDTTLESQHDWFAKTSGLGLL